MTHDDAIKVMLVDDQHLLRMGFKLILEGEDDVEVVAEAADGAEALRLMDTLGDKRPDVVLMDVRMPTMDGIEATRRIVDQHSETRVIILTTFDLDEYAFSGLQAGASAFLLKDVEPAELVNAVRVVASGDAVVAPRITQRLLDIYLRKGTGEVPSQLAQAVAQDTASTPQSPETVTPTGEQIAQALDDGVPREPLTARETEVLFAVAEGLSNAEIAGKFFLSEATVKTHVRRILTKLQLRDRVQAVVYVYQTGLVGSG
ncbi:response regulator [Nesterenkonia alba]|uniref:response regulator n=1 Tax=Nesterenkonia alba TaxID=515814 RepID=UPI0003B6FBFD|nr:response regulator transcription factor [Nesterenkonia alba]